jgi:type 1 glutamine amidotransferase
MTLNRRQLLIASGAAAIVGPGAWDRLCAANATAETKRVLFFTKSAGFPHPVVTRKGDQLSHAERILTDLGKQHGFEVTCSKDGTLFDPDKIGQWDAFAFETTGDLTTPGTDKTPPMSQAGKQAFLDAIHNGKGFMGMHCATDTFHSQGNTIDPYIQMIGGEFSGHGAQQEATLEIVDPSFPGVKEFGSGSFKMTDEWYGQRNLADDLHVILVQVTQGMQGRDYQRPNYPQTWTRQHGKGRVFYTSMGHREDVWSNPKFQGLLLGALLFITGQAEGSTEPNVSKVTPGYKDVPARG